jgi:acetolactate synthase-1/2/3 large subunit
MTAKPAARVVVDILGMEGVRTIFGLPGGHTIGILDALYDRPEIRFVRVRHEHSAAHMAVAWAQLTGEPGVVLVTAGPASTNLATGIAEAHVGARPLVVLAGRAPTAHALRGESQEVPTDRVYAPITKWSVRVDRADLIPEVLRNAFALAASGRPGPVYVDLPADILGQPIEPPLYRPAIRTTAPAADPELVRQAARRLAAAERPLIVAGGGAVAANAFAEVAALAERLSAPVVTSLSGRGIIPDDHPLSAGGLGTHSTPFSQRLLNEADVILNLGCRFESMETNWTPDFSPAKDACHIQVNLDAAEIGRSFPAEIGVVADARAFAASLLAALDKPRQDGAASARRAHVAEAVAALDRDAARMEASNRSPIHPVRIIRAARKVFPREATLAADIGCLAEQLGGAFPWFRVFAPRSVIAPSSFYGMGDAAAGLPVSRLVYPDRPAIGFVGDGSFQMILDVLPVAAEYRLGVTWVILNDMALGSIRDIQAGRLGGRFIGTDFAFNPDFARLAEACGCYGEKVEAPGDVEAALERALAANQSGQPAVLDCLVMRARSPQTAKFFHIKDAEF